MPIKVTCEKCGGVLHAPDDAGGKKGRCPNCQNILPIPFDAARAPTFGQPPSTPSFGSSVSAGPPPGMAFASPAPFQNPNIPNADVKRPVAPPPFGAGSRAEAPGLGSSTPGLGSPPVTFGGPSQFQGPNVQSSVPFPASRMNPSAMQPIAPDRTGWASAAAGLRWVQAGVMLMALGLVATAGVSIYGATAGQALAEKPGVLKWTNLPQLAELRCLAFVVPAALGALALVLGRWRFSLVPESSGARGAARWSAFYSLLAVIGFLVLVGMTILAMKNGGTPNLHPKGIVAEAGTPFATRVMTYFRDVLLPGDQVPGAIQRFGLIAMLLCGKVAELFFGCSLGRIGAHLRDSSAGRVTGTYAFFALIGLVLAFALVTFEMFGESAARTVWGPKWWEISIPTRTMIVSGTAIGIALISMGLYLRMLGSVRESCRSAAA